MSLRSAVTRIATASARPIARRTLVTLPAARSNAESIAFRAAPRIATIASRHLSSSAIRFGGGETDAALSAKLGEELNYEVNEATALAGQDPDWLAEFKEAGVWKIVDKKGADEVSFERTFGNEKLRLTFSISDLDNPPDTSDLEASTTEETSGSEEADVATFPIRCSLFVTKPSAPQGTGALVMDLLVEDGQFVIDNASFYEDAKLAQEMTAEGDWKRRGTYVGPKFDHLDAAVQAEFEAYLSEREVNEQLAYAIPLYCEYKEQKEYMSWLRSVKNFVDQ